MAASSISFLSGLSLLTISEGALEIIPVEHFHQTCNTFIISVDGPVLQQFNKTSPIVSRWIQESKVDPVSYRPCVSDLITSSHVCPSGPQKQSSTEDLG